MFDEQTTCLVAGGGPAGMVLGVLLARAGVDVVVLEKHADFFRDFRGDTIHPSTLETLEQMGLLDRFNRLPQQRARQLSAHFGARVQPIADFRGLRPFDYLAFVPQWDFLDLLASAGAETPRFALRMQHEVTDLIEVDGRIAGVRVETPAGSRTIGATLVVGCDGRHSTTRRAAALVPVDYGAPMDVLWFRLPRRQDQPIEPFGIVGPGHLLVLLNRDDYWQAGYVIDKGGDEALRAGPIDVLRESIATMAPFLADATASLDSWERVRTLVVQVDRLDRWWQPGLLVIGDAAHAMSPIGGVGINLAIQDAVAAANRLAGPLAAGAHVDGTILERIQARRAPATRRIQRLQLFAQRRMISRVLASGDRQPDLPAIVRWILRARWVRRIPARVIGYGFGREAVATASGAQPTR